MNKNTLSIIALTVGFGVIAACSASNAPATKKKSTSSAGAAGTGAGVAGTGQGVSGTGQGVSGTGQGVSGTGQGVSGTGQGVSGTGTGTSGAGGGQTFVMGNLIDDLADGDNVIAPYTDGQGHDRVGYWYTFNDGTGTQWPPPDTSGTGATPFIACGGLTPDATNCPLAPSRAGGADYFAEMNITGFTTWGAGMGFTLNNQTPTKMPYNASAYSGISFYAKASLPTTVHTKIAIPTITNGSDWAKDIMVTTAWTQFTIGFSGDALFKQPSWAAMPSTGTAQVFPFTKDQITDIQWQVDQAINCDLAVDDITFM